jgi:hypothetical protein
MNVEFGLRLRNSNFFAVIFLLDSPVDCLKIFQQRPVLFLHENAASCQLLSIHKASKIAAMTGRISAGIFKQFVGAKNRVGIGLSCRPARLHSPAEQVPWNRFFGS